ncbi:DNA-binding protein [Schnuerera sp. xch1]|uniref:PPC domain-containing DNA-binding protein n=1 Tax=Schnuerera sp. xch1 TaxID=2874283 RepID=UPI001CC1BA60|nr:PPC domain-containing DNA-binding protein [Schnuerera sp. xch1]MBZ2174968.1 DNA-binding protein [Schnuerera sp. xch1]
MKYKKFVDKYVVRLERGEEVINSLTNLCKENEIKLGRVTGIGATNKVTIGLFNTESKEYHSKDLTGDMEITNLSGNITSMDEEVYLHLHITVCDKNNKAYGGHLNSAVISATCEMIIDVIDGNVGRRHDEEIGLNLFKFNEDSIESIH